MWPGLILGVAFAVLTRNAVGLAVIHQIEAYWPGHQPALEWVAVIAQAVAGVLIWRFFAQTRMRGLSGFWTTTLGRWVIGRLAGAAVFLALFGLAWKPAFYAVWLFAIAPIDVAGMKAALLVYWGFYPLVWALALYAAWFLRTPAKIFIGKASGPLRRWYRSLRMGAGGSASFAGICEEWANRWRPGAIFLGHSLFDRHWPVGVRDDRMLCTMAGTGGGKGDSAIIPNLLLHPGSAFAIDVKGQLAAVTAAARRGKGHTVHIIDPFNVLGQGTARIDPLSDLDPDALDYVERLRKTVDAMVISTGERNRFFDEGGKTIVAGAIDYLKRRGTGEFVPPQEVLEVEETGE